MKTVFEFIEFREIAQKPKTSIWGCFNRRHGEQLGQIAWYGAWRQYVYEPSGPAVYSVGCLNDIAGFVGTLNVMHRPTERAAAEPEPAVRP